MSEQRTGPLWQAIRLAADGAPEGEFLARAREAKEAITDSFYTLWREITVLDNLVARVAPSADWQEGIQERHGSGPSSRPPTTAPTQSASVRQRRILELANKFADGGATSVSSKAIAEQLVVDGFPGSMRNLSVSVGNVLARSGDWQRGRPGEYEKVLV